MVLEAELKSQNRIVFPTNVQGNISVPIGQTVEVGPHCVVMSGTAEILHGIINNVPINEDSWETREWDVHLIIGPAWRDVKQASPMVAPAIYYNYDADEDDEQGFELGGGCKWDEVEDNDGKKRIRLRFKMKQFGEDSRFRGIVFHVVATGSLLEY